MRTRIIEVCLGGIVFVALAFFATSQFAETLPAVSSFSGDQMTGEYDQERLSQLVREALAP